MSDEKPLKPSLPLRKDYVEREAGHWLLAIVVGLAFLVVFALVGIIYVLRR